MGSLADLRSDVAEVVEENAPEVSSEEPAPEETAEAPGELPFRKAVFWK